MLLFFVVCYIVVSIGVGLFAARWVKNSADYVSAGRHLPLPMVIATVFATWFGAEVVLGIPGSFLSDGLAGIVEDPFGASMCLVLVGLFFARKLYRMNLMTIGDFYKMRYGRTVEIATSLAIIISYLGWVSAQITALGLVLSTVFPVLGHREAMMTGAAVVVIYTLFGGMWSVAVTDFMQMTFIVIGLLIVAMIIADKAGGVMPVFAHAQAAGKFRMLPDFSAASLVTLVGTGITMMLGSIPQQDVFQRVNSAKTEKIAAAGAIIGGTGYFLFAFIPIFITYAANIIDPSLLQDMLARNPDGEGVLAALIKKHTPIAVQILFYGALISAIMSTASGTLLAPSTTFAENIIRPLLPKLDDRHLLTLIRFSVIMFSVFVTTFAMTSTASIYETVGNSYKVTLVAAFIPLVCGLYWPKASTIGALTSMGLGVSVWLLCEIAFSDWMIVPQFAGFLAAGIGMAGGSVLFPRAEPFDLKSARKTFVRTHEEQA
ncbi:MAG: sodium:solute symporter family protein [Chitinispirillaceae bacterium]|jgi:SSS family transporter|nr:sodium:solute symporter family protein [Chitinispirillaceae bacterium]